MEHLTCSFCESTTQVDSHEARLLYSRAISENLPIRSPFLNVFLGVAYCRKECVLHVL